MAERLNGDDYLNERDGMWANAWDILLEGCEIPPSLEGFKHGLELVRGRSRAPISVQQYARTLSDNYQRIQ